MALISSRGISRAAMRSKTLLMCLYMSAVQAVACFLRPQLLRQPLCTRRWMPRSAAVLCQTWLCAHPKSQGTGTEDGQRVLRFEVGDRVIANTGFGTVEGVVIKLWYREPDWPAERVAPYQIELPDGTLVYAPKDSDHLVRPAGAEPFVPKRLARTAEDVARAYPPISLHPDLFDPSAVDDWVVDQLRLALVEWQRTGDVSSIDMGAIPGLRLEAPGVVSFEFLKPAFCDVLLAEARHYSESGMPQRAPNSMNKYGVILNDIGMRPCFDRLLERYSAALGALLFGGTAPTYIEGELAQLEDWGGGSLSEHHTFVVRYRPDQDRHLDMHVDECDVVRALVLCPSGRGESSNCSVSSGMPVCAGPWRLTASDDGVLCTRPDIQHRSLRLGRLHRIGSGLLRHDWFGQPPEACQDIFAPKGAMCPALRQTTPWRSQCRQGRACEPHHVDQEPCLPKDRSLPETMGRASIKAEAS